MFWLQAYCTERRYVLVTGLLYFFFKSLYCLQTFKTELHDQYSVRVKYLNRRYVLVTGLLYRQALCFDYRPTVSTGVMFWLQAYCIDRRCFGYRPTVSTGAMFWLQVYCTDSRCFGYRPTVSTVALLVRGLLYPQSLFFVTSLLYRLLLCVGYKFYFKFCVSVGRLITLIETFLWLSSVSSSKYCVIILNKPQSNTSTSFSIRHS